MYLSRIELTGFKSFADKTVIDFDPGLTAVVGPNGSGKSNISEAIRWVLGEQSARSLRGNRMEDVIFNGTQERKAVNIARVTLVLNNEDRYLDYDLSEISLTRSYNRNGDSEFYINNEAVRLKDIVDLLLDSGLGKNSFSIISQGQVEQIFLNKPEERRVIFEEAAGVQRYQYRKNEASRKMERSEDNLSRVRDIIHELEQQLTPLKKQREAALTYQEKYETLKQLEISMYAHQIEQRHQDWQKLEEKLKSLQQTIHTNEHDLEEQQHLLTSLRQHHDELLDNIEVKNDTYQTLTRQIDQTTSKLMVVEQQMEFNQVNRNKNQSDYAKREADHLTNQKELASLKLTRTDREQQINTLEKEIKELQQQSEWLSSDPTISRESIQNELIEMYQEEATLKNQSKNIEEQLSGLSHRVRREEEAMSVHQMKLIETESTIKDEQSKYTALKTYLSSKQSEADSVQELFNNIESERQRIRANVFELERVTERQTSRVQQLESAITNYAGFYGGVRSIMSARDLLKGIIGPVADIIQVEAEYSTAIDTALGASLQHIIVEDDQAARRSIQYLRDKRAGRAAFLPVTNIRSRHLDSSFHKIVSQMPGYIGMGNECVTTDSTYQAIIDQLLGVTVVVDHIEHAQAMAQAVNHRVRFVTLSGELLNPGGSITGGRQKHQSQSMLQRQHELEEAQAIITTNARKLKALEKRWQTLDHKEKQLRQDDEAETDYYRQQEQHYHQLSTTIQTLQQEINQRTQQLSFIRTQIQDAKAEREQLTIQQAEVSNALTKLTEQLAQKAQQLEDMSQDEHVKDTQRQSINHQLHELEKEKAIEEMAFRQISQQVQDLEQRIQAHEHYFTAYASEEANDQETQTTLEKEQSSLKEALETLKVQTKPMPDAIQSLREERRHTQERVYVLENDLKQLQAILQTNYQKQTKWQTQVENHQSQIDQQLDYLAQEYQLSYEAAAEQKLAIKDLKETQQTVRTLHQEIERLGPINIQAIEDYDVLHARFEHLTHQENDLLTAIAQLQETMNEMDQEVIKRFGVMFHRINEQFQHAFRRLFGGGMANLALTDPDDLLTTGVDIIAQPPGKRKQNLALLSGGERALTAIALLFAILEVRPVPFVVLDEVEAALDDANVYRYGEYIKNFTEETQFIVITHRRGTMEAADVLYGVTMEKSGISKLASVRLTEAIESEEGD